MAQRSSKRQRANHGGAYHDTVPLTDDDLSSVQFREGRLRRVGNTLFTAIATHSYQHDATSWQQATSWSIPDDPNYALDPDGDLYDQALEADIMQEEESLPDASAPKQRSRVSKRPHVIWKELHRNTYLDEILRWAGRGDFRTAEQCPDCLARKIAEPGEPIYRCHDCFLPDLACLSCCLKRHRVHPLHRIEKWTGDRFTPVTLKSLGLKVQMNHGGLFCSNPIPCHQSMIVLHTNGLHDVALQYCGCDRAVPPHLQLLRRRLYPASQILAKACASFELLDLLHKMALTTKASTYDFYRGLEKLTDNTGLAVPKSRYRALFRMNMQWRHLKMLKWGGRGHDPTGAEGTKEGELAVMCPSCPRPLINLPSNWEEAPLNLRFLYTMFVCMDANFRLKNQFVSNYSQDPGLGTGYSYLVPRARYESYVLSRASDADISTCVGLQALAQAHTRNSDGGLRYTGVGGVMCGRSEMILPLGVGNLQKGERYANMDYLFGSAVHSVALLLILISYDIACQWFVNIAKRMEEHWPPEIKLSPDVKLEPAIPKLHEPMHETANHQEFSLNFIPGVGNSDFECPERVWGSHNPLAPSTKTAGPGTRHDTLDDNFGFWNWLKYNGQGRTLLQKYRRGIADRNTQVEGHRGLTRSLGPALTAAWEAISVAWEEDTFPKAAKNPYHSETAPMTEADIRNELAKEDECRLSSSGDSSLHETSASGFIVLGLELEQMQRRILRAAKQTTDKATARQAGGLTERRNLLRVRLRAWERLLPTYMPGLAQYLAQRNSNVPTTPRTLGPRPQPEDQQLWLPSAFSTADRSKVAGEHVADIEARLRLAQASDALESLRHILKIKTRMIYFKNKNVQGQKDGTRSRSFIDGIHDKAKAAAEKYRAARRAKLALSGSGDWEDTYRVLDDKDVRGYQDPNRLRPRHGRLGTFDDEQVARAAAEASLNTSSPVTEPELPLNALVVEDRRKRDGTGDTRRTLSWIWSTKSPGLEDDGDDLLRVEWAKSRARAHRANEEVLLVREEMRRVLAFLDWRMKWWQERESMRTDVDKSLHEGLIAYARGQASLQLSLADSFRALWQAPLQAEDVSLTQPAPEATEPDDEEEDEDVEGAHVDDDADDDADDDEE